jgi:hypothetical protein
MVELLIRRGANIEQRVGSYTAADYAYHYGHDHLLGLLNGTAELIYERAPLMVVT